jgi:hypothetical protein
MTRILFAFALACVALVTGLTAYGHLLHTPAPRPPRNPATEDSIRLLLEGVDAATLTLGQLDSLAIRIMATHSVTGGLE